MTVITSPKIKKLAAKALKPPSMLTTEETRELGASVMAHLSYAKEDFSAAGKNSSANMSPAKKLPAKRS